MAKMPRSAGMTMKSGNVLLSRRKPERALYQMTMELLTATPGGARLEDSGKRLQASHACENYQLIWPM
jgi:hypothetical protein